MVITITVPGDKAEDLSLAYGINPADYENPEVAIDKFLEAFIADIRRRYLRYKLRQLETDTSVIPELILIAEQA